MVELDKWKHYQLWDYAANYSKTRTKLKRTRKCGQFSPWWMWFWNFPLNRKGDQTGECASTRRLFVPMRLWIKLEKKASFENYTENLEKSERQLNQMAVSVQTSQLDSVCSQKQWKRRLTCLWQSLPSPPSGMSPGRKRRRARAKTQLMEKCLLLYGSFSFKTFTLHVHRLKSKQYRRT